MRNAVYCLVVLLASARSDTRGTSLSFRDPDADTEIASKRELLAIMDKLEPKLPAELRRKLIVISMKLATGWCSPYLTVELEQEIEKLTVEEKKGLEPEWSEVKKHKAWPRMPPEAKPKKPSETSG